MSDPSAFEIMEALRAHPKKFVEMAAQTYKLADLVLEPWDDYAGEPDHALWERLTAGDDVDSWTRTSVFRKTKQSATWDWYVFGSNEEGEDGKWPVLESREGLATAEEAMRDCDRWLIDQGYYLLEPKCELTPEDIDETYGGSYSPSKEDSPGTHRSVEVVRIIDAFLTEVAERWASATEPNDLHDLPRSPGDISIADLADELKRRAGP